MIPNGEGYHLAVNKPALVRGIASKNNGIFYWFNFLHSFRARSKLVSHKNVYKNKAFCNVLMTSDDSKIFEFNQYHKFDKTPLFTQILNL